LGKLNLDDSALHADYGGMGSVVSTQFGEDVPGLALDGLFADRKLRCNLFVSIPFGDQTQDTDFRWGQGVIGGMFGDLVEASGDSAFFPAWTPRIVSNNSLCKLFVEQMSRKPAMQESTHFRHLQVH
jgi:hypothetical protein